MHGDKKQCLAQQVQRFRARFVQSVGRLLGEVIPQSALTQWINEETAGYRERIYNPFTTLVLFIEQVLGADHSCQDAVARGLSARVALGQPPCSLNTGPYCKARARLALGLLTRLAREVGAALCAQQPEVWRWLRPGSQADRWHNGVDAGHESQPGALSPEPHAETRVGLSRGAPGRHRLAVHRWRARMGDGGMRR